jgi:hypothetical protein
MIEGSSKAQSACRLWSLDAASRELGTDPETLFNWLSRRRNVYRYSGLGNGKKLAFLHWVRSGLFENQSEVMITAAGMRLLGNDYSSPAKPSSP